jgi:hypothetical protein
VCSSCPALWYLPRPGGGGSASAIPGQQHIASTHRAPLAEQLLIVAGRCLKAQIFASVSTVVPREPSASGSGSWMHAWSGNFQIPCDSNRQRLPAARAGASEGAALLVTAREVCVHLQKHNCKAVTSRAISNSIVWVQAPPCSGAIMDEPARKQARGRSAGADRRGTKQSPDVSAATSVTGVSTYAEPDVTQSRRSGRLASQ